MTLPPNWLDYAIDAIVIVAVTALVGVKVVDKEVWLMVVLPIVGARAALRKPNGESSSAGPSAGAGAVLAMLGVALSGKFKT